MRLSKTGLSVESSIADLFPFSSGIAKFSFLGAWAPDYVCRFFDYNMSADQFPDFSKISQFLRSSDLSCSETRKVTSEATRTSNFR